MPHKPGVSRVTIEIGDGEKILAIRSNSHYELGHPLGDVVSSHIIAEAIEVQWCSVSQKWVG